MQPNVVTCLFIGVASWFAVDKLFQLAKVSGTVAYTLSLVVLVASAGTAAWLENRSHEISDQSQNWFAVLDEEWHDSSRVLCSRVLCSGI
jgi:hypothetical protein